MTPRETILSQAIAHTCAPGQCSGAHAAGLLEIPSITFVQAAESTPPKDNGEPLAPT